MAASDLDELINYGISRRSTGRSRLTLARDLAKLQVSLRLPDGLVTRHLGRYLNLGLELAAPQRPPSSPGRRTLGDCPYPAPCSLRFTGRCCDSPATVRSSPSSNAPCSG